MENKIIKITLWMNGREFEYDAGTISEACEALQGMRDLEPDMLQDWIDDERTGWRADD